MGDGSFGFAVGELETVVRKQLPITFVVFSNCSFGNPARRLYASSPVLTPKRTCSTIPERNHIPPSACWARVRMIPVNSTSRQQSTTSRMDVGWVMSARKLLRPVLGEHTEHLGPVRGVIGKHDDFAILAGG